MKWARFSPTDSEGMSNNSVLRLSGRAQTLFVGELAISRTTKSSHLILALISSAALGAPSQNQPYNSVYNPGGQV